MPVGCFASSSLAQAAGSASHFSSSSRTYSNAGRSRRSRNGETVRRNVFDAAADRAGIADVTPHGLRHTAASLAIASGATVVVVCRMLGHSSPSVTLNVY